VLAATIPELVAGSAGLADSGCAPPRGMSKITPASFAGRFVAYGPREQGMGAALNGIALHGGLLPYGAVPLMFTDQMRPAMRLAAVMGQRVIFVVTDGDPATAATDQPVEQLASLRAIPNLHVLRPADALEMAECWELALRRADGPTVIAAGSQSAGDLPSGSGDNRVARGGYVAAPADGARQATLIASGAEVGAALSARETLAAEGIAVAVVSLPCWERFAQQDEAYRDEVLGGVPRFGIEAAGGFGWERWLGPHGIFIGMTGFGASGSSDDVYRPFGITSDAIVTAVRRRLGDPPTSRKE
jgi:transketolase